jgi:pimeloyl-ACP methyl ester carboxylesterase
MSRAAGTVNERFTLTLADGRALDVAIAGAREGRAIVFHSGTPIGGIPYAPFVAAAAERGALLVHYSRPGYAGSTRQPGRSVADCVPDVTALLDHLGIESATTVGWSGGGPHALACAALLPSRITRAATLSGVAPYDAQGLDFLAGMGAENLVEFGAAVEGTAALVPYLEHEAAPLRTITPDAVAAALGDLVDHVDRASVTGPFADWLAAAMREAVRTGIWGWHDDILRSRGRGGSSSARSACR